MKLLQKGGFPVSEGFGMVFVPITTIYLNLDENEGRHLPFVLLCVSHNQSQTPSA